MRQQVVPPGAVGRGPGLEGGQDALQYVHRDVSMAEGLMNTVLSVREIL